MPACNCQHGKPNLCLHKAVLGVSIDGGFAEYCRVRYTNVYQLPAGVSFEEGALTEPLACATYAMQGLDVQLGNTCVIIGPGPIGLMMVQLAKAAGAGRVILVGTRDYRLEVGRALGAAPTDQCTGAGIRSLRARPQGARRRCNRRRAG